MLQHSLLPQTRIKLHFHRLKDYIIPEKIVLTTKKISKIVMWCDNITLKPITELEVVCMKLATRRRKNNDGNPKSNGTALGTWRKVRKAKHGNECRVPEDRSPPLSERWKADAWRDLERGWNISAGYRRGEKSRQRERATAGRKLTRRGSTPAVHVKPETSLFELWPARDHISNSGTWAVLRRGGGLIPVTVSRTYTNLSENETRRDRSKSTYKINK